MATKNQPLKILHLEDLAIDVDLISKLLEKSGLRFKTFVSIDEKSFIAGLTTFLPDIILADHSLPSFDSVAALKILRDRKITIPFILVTATTTEEAAVNIMREGAWDFILKDRIQRLPSAIAHAMEKHNSQLEKHQTETELAIANRRLLFHIDGIDQKDGLHYAGGNTTLYYDLLIKFSDSYQNFISDLKNKFISGQLEESSRMLRTLKGVSGNLGMTYLQEKCDLTELLLQHESVTVDESVLVLADEMNRILNSLSKNLGTNYRAFTDK